MFNIKEAIKYYSNRVRQLEKERIDLQHNIEIGQLTSYEEHLQFLKDEKENIDSLINMCKHQIRRMHTIQTKNTIQV